MYLHEDQYTFFIVTHSVLLRMRNFSDKSRKENQNIHFMFNNDKNQTIYDIM